MRNMRKANTKDRKNPNPELDESSKLTFAAQLPAALLNAFHTNNRINQYLIENIAPAAWKTKPPDGKGRTISAIVAHMHNVRVMWLKVSAKGSEIPAQLNRATVTPAQALRGLENSCEALAC
jgi:uncharacterized damage-inducible protein DinB